MTKHLAVQASSISKHCTLKQVPKKGFHAFYKEFEDYKVTFNVIFH